VSGGPPDAARVRVPATSANLGPAFDCAGLALSCYDVVEARVTGGGLSVEVTGVGAGELPTDASHLVVRAFRAACDVLGWSPPGLALRARNGIPQGRGMGSSAAAVVAGVVAAWALCPDRGSRDDPRTDPAVLRLVSELEGHPDNVAACLLGGATLSWMAGDGARAARVDVDHRVLPVLLVPEATLSTHVARGLLPDVVPHADAACAAGRSALLVHALARDPFLLLEATEDRLHQRQRAPAMPASLELLERLRAAGHAAVVSGAGPSLLVLTQRHPDDPPGDPVHAVRVRRVAELVPAGWRFLALDVDPTGARLTVPGPAVSFT
jgi:homoserine kinase